VLCNFEDQNGRSDIVSWATMRVLHTYLHVRTYLPGSLEGFRFGQDAASTYGAGSKAVETLLLKRGERALQTILRYSSAVETPRDWTGNGEETGAGSRPNAGQLAAAGCAPRQVAAGGTLPLHRPDRRIPEPSGLKSPGLGIFTSLRFRTAETASFGDRIQNP
jgi:hypothetical protein